MDLEKLLLAVVASGLIVLPIVIYVSYKSDMKEWNDFNNECLHYHKQYECTSLYRKGQTETAWLPVVPIYTH